MPGKPGPASRHALPTSGYQYRRLVTEIAIGKRTYAELASWYSDSITVSAIANFARRHRFDIELVREHASDPYILLWLADKTDRMAELQKLYERLDAESSRIPDSDTIRAQAAILKQASEELGQLPPRQQVVSARVSHVVEGWSSDDLDELLTGGSQGDPGERELPPSGHSRPALPGEVLQLHDAPDPAPAPDNAVPLRRGSGPEPGGDRP